MAGNRGVILVGLLAVMLVHQGHAGALQDREKEVKKKASSKSEKKSKSSKSDRGDQVEAASFGSGTYPSAASSGGGGSFIPSFWSWLVSSPFWYRADDPGVSLLSDEDEGWAKPATSFFPKHAPGQHTVPYLRGDYNYQFIDEDGMKDAHDGRIEVGYKLLAFHGRFTRYEEDSGFTLDLQQYYAVLRFGGKVSELIPGTFEAGIGAGAVHHGGDVESDDSWALTLPLKYYPVDWCGIEYRLATYDWHDERIHDHDISVSLGYRFVQLRGGYRWLWDDEVIDVQSGPYVGTSISF